MTSPRGRPVMWFEPAPPRHLWKDIIPLTQYNCPTSQDAAAKVETIKNAGNEDMGTGNCYEALWKYHNAAKICMDCGLISEMATIQGNCAQACLNMDLYEQAYAHARNNVELNPDSPKAYYRRAEAVRQALSAQEILELEALMVPGLPFARAIPGAIMDYWECHRIKQNSKALCEAIILAIDFQLTDLLKDISVSSDVCPKVFSELVRKQNVKQEYIRFLISRQQFNASGIELSTLMKSSVLDKALLERMFQLGLKVQESDIQEAVQTLCDKDEHILDVILSKYGSNDPHSLDQPCRGAVNAKKHKLASCLRRHGAKYDDPKELVDKTKQEGNEFFKRKQYDDALGKYFRALRICREHQFNDEMALIRGNCAQACLKLELYKDAYDHADKCVRLDPKLHKGYYRRAEALRLMLSSPKHDWIAPGKDFRSVVEDYCHCHRIKPNVDVLCEAVMMAVDHSCTDLLPALQDMELTTQLLKELLSKPETTQDHFQCIILPKGAASKPQFNGTRVNLSAVLKKRVTDVQVLERLFQMGMDVAESDVELAVECLPDKKFDLLKLIVSKYDEVSIACLNRMCRLAMKAKKIKFTACFIEYGAKPPCGELKRLIGWPGKEIDLVFARYISSVSQEISPKPNQPKSSPKPQESKSSSKPNQPKSFTPLPSGPEITPFPSAYHQESVKRLNAEGKLCFKSKDYDGALEKYMSALEVCRQYGVHMREEMAILHGNTARVLLELRAYEAAYQHATSQLQFDPISDKGFQRRAEALKRALLCPYMQPPGLTFANVISDFLRCHEIKPNVKALSEAIILAVDHGFISEFLAPPPVLTESDVKSGFCGKLFREILSRDDVELKHLDFLVFQLFDQIPTPFNASSIKLSQLLEKAIVGMKFLRKMFELGMMTSTKDIETAVKVLPDTSVSTLELIVSKQSEVGSLDLPFQAALKARKMRFIAWFIEHGAKTPDELSVLLTQTLDQKDFNIAKVFLEASGSITCKDVDLGIPIAAGLIDHPELIERLIDAGADPNGHVKKTLDEVVNAKLPVKNKVDLICLLLNKGADCNHLSLVGKTTTPLHVATELALEAVGDKRIIDAVFASSTFSPPHDGKIVDHKGQTPLHIAVKAQTKRGISCAVLTALTETNCINPFVKDVIKSKQAVDYLDKKDKRYNVLRRAEEEFRLKTSSQGRRKKPPKKNNTGPVTNTQPTPTSCTEATHCTNDDLKISEIQGKEENPTHCTNDDLTISEIQGKEENPTHCTNDDLTISEIQGKEENPTHCTNDDLTISEIQGKEENPSVVENIPQFQDQESATFSPTTQKQLKLEQDKLSLNVKLEQQLERILKQGVDYFLGHVKSTQKSNRSLININGKPSQKESTSNQEVPVVSAGPPAVIEQPQEDQPDDIFETGDMNELFAEYGITDFDKLPWEVEVTKRVIKFFKDKKKNPYKLRLSAVQTISSLAEGRRSEKLSKQVGSEPKLQLFEAKISKASRILWEKAISFSARRTGSQSHHIYAQVIRIWEIVVDHDQLNHYIELIKQTHKRGSEASQCLPLSIQKGNNVISGEPIRGREIIDLPLTFLSIDSDSNEHFIPAASMKEDEYNVTTFYSFSTALVKSVLTGENTRCDFPFKEWPKEHDIISLKNDKSILLLGRSGTGKTTCCLYRLWNEFRMYWDPELRHPDTRIPRKALVSLPPPEIEEEEETTEDDGGSDSESLDALNSTASSSTNLPQTQVSASTHKHVTSGHLQPPDEENREDHEADSHCDNLSEGSASAFEDTKPVSDETLEDLHPVFITKNYVLCTQMKRRFYDMMAAHNFFTNHMEFENAKPPNTLTGMNDHAFPLFLTAREFYIILDNSLEDEDKFFHRDSEGNLSEKVVSSDYDHEDPDTLLDLEESDSEGEDNDQGIAAPLQEAVLRKEKWVEVTSLYFTEKVWPNISHNPNLKGVDPLLVWMEIQSFIKGSETALRKGSPLSLEEYRNVGGKLAPNFSDYRKEIYDVFKQYQTYCQNQRLSTFLFDECDLIQDLHRRMCKVRDVPWSVHCFYIDEVQDFTQAELALFLRCCRDPNSTFFTGDTAQSIMRGITFRFQDLRSLFHRIHKTVPQVKVPCKPHTLTVNFRSHSGILGLAQSVLDLLCEFFPSSIDNLPEDKGMFPGPIPVLLESCDITDLAFLLSTNKREKSAIEFGAHQVILVQSKKAKDDLPSILKGAIVLTIFESKGLEFDDVLLYNFFTDSMVDEKGWRVTTTYFEGHEADMRNTSRLPGSKTDPRGVTFNEGHHKSLNAELKYLYTAVTRAKCNLWIYDSDRKKRLPVFDYWHKRGLVKVVGTELSQGDQHSLIFASISTSEQWKVQGDYFMKKHLWEQAMHCYQKAGSDSVHLVKEAEAFSLIHKARHSQPDLYLTAALCFLECDQLSHDARLLHYGAVCLMNARHVRHHVNAAKLFESLGKDDKAFKAYKRAREFDRCARLMQKEGRFNDAVRILDQANKKREALAKADEYERRDIHLEQELSTNELSYKYAKRYLRLKDTSKESESTLLEMLAYMNDTSRKIRFLKEGRMYNDAYDTHVEQKQYRDAYRLASAQEWFKSGRSLAKQQKDNRMEVQFIFQQIKTEWNEPDCQSQIREELHSLIKSQDPPTKAFACLLLGKLEKDIRLCRTARETYKFRRNKVGESEAFHAIAQIEKSDRKESIQSVFNACQAAHGVERMLRLDPDKRPSAMQVQQQASEFYGFQKIGDVYHMAPHQDIWIGKLEEQCACKDEKTDLDGMLRLSAPKTREQIANHCKSLMNKWVCDYQLQQKLEDRLKSSKLHKEFSKSKFLSRVISTTKVTATLKDYIQNCIQFFELNQLDPRIPYVDKILLLLSIFSPQISIYLPLSKEHIKPVRESEAAKAAIQGWIKGTIQKLRKEMGRVLLDQMLNIWRACCITGNISSLNASLVEWATKVSTDAKAHTAGYQPPPGFIFSANEKEYYHLFSFWLQSCELIRKGQALHASELAIIHFLCNIATSKGTAFIPVMNCVEVLSIHCTALLAMIAQLDSPFCQFQLPMLYKHSVQLFDDLNASSWEERLLMACAKEVKQRARTTHYQNKLRSKCLDMLWLALDLILGKHVRGFSVLRYAMKQQRPLESVESLHCLVLAVTLFGNLMVTQSRPLQDMIRYQKSFCYVLEKSLQTQNASDHVYIQDALNTFRSECFIFNTIEVFSLLHRLLRKSDETAALANLKVLQNGIVDFCEFRPTRRKMKPLKQLQTSPHSPSSHSATIVATKQISPQAEDLQDHSQLDIQPVFSHPHGAVLSSQAGQPQAQTVSQTPSDENKPISPVQPKDTEMFSHLHTANAGFQSHTELEIPSPEDIEFAGGVTYQRQTSEPELMRMESDPGNFLEPDANVEFAGGVTYQRQTSEPELMRMESDPGDSLDPDANVEFAGDVTYQRQTSEPELMSDPGDFLEPETQPELGAVEQKINSKQVDTSEHEAVDSNFCSACGVGVRPAAPTDQEESEAPQEAEVDDSVETYDCHVSSEAHKRNVILYKKFKSDRNWYYYPLKEELSEMLKKCQSVRSTLLLDKIIDEITEVIEESEKEIEQLQDAAEWQEGIEKISDISDQMNALLKRSEEEYTKVACALPTEQTLEANEEDVEKQESEEEELVEHGNVELELRTSEEKIKSRRKKRQKKKVANV